MTPFAYYNENDPKTALWLKELIRRGLVMDGIVDTRSITEVTPSDVEDFTRCHFFAGIGGWDKALQLAGWSEDWPVWTGSCPCQPFSAAGKGKGHADPRHLWPYWGALIALCRPPVVFGEQVEAAIRHGWLDTVFGDLEEEGYACGAGVLGAHSVGAPHIRQRVWFVAESQRPTPESWRIAGQPGEGDGAASTRASTELHHQPRPQGQFLGRDSADQCVAGAAGVANELADAQSEVRQVPVRAGRPQPTVLESGGGGGVDWSRADWLPCRDGKWRPVEPGTFPLAHGVPARVGRLRGYGNAIVPQVAAAFIEAYWVVSHNL